MSGVCLVTGGARGIGAATALRAAQAGYAVGVGYHQHPQRATAVVDQIRGRGGAAAALAGDVACEADVVAMFDQAERELGPLRALVNSAGINHHGRVDGLRADDLAWLLAVNVMGLMLCCREAVRRMAISNGALAAPSLTSPRWRPQ